MIIFTHFWHCSSEYKHTQLFYVTIQKSFVNNCSQRLGESRGKAVVIAQGREPRVGEWGRLGGGGGGQKQRQSSSDLAQSNASTLAAQNWVQRLCC